MQVIDLQTSIAVFGITLNKGRFPADCFILSSVTPAASEINKELSDNDCNISSITLQTKYGFTQSTIISAPFTASILLCVVLMPLSANEAKASCETSDKIMLLGGVEPSRNKPLTKADPIFPTPKIAIFIRKICIKNEKLAQNKSFTPTLGLFKN